jgi:hypothetical protein
LKKELFAVKNKTIRLGYVPEEEICLLYNSCNLFVFPSLHEGFGFPVLEAFACEVPVICSNATSLPEVGGEGALYFNPRDPADISNKIKELLTDKEKSKMLIKKGVQRLKEFTWKKCAEKTFEVYKNTYNKSDFKSKYTAAKSYLEYIHQNKRIKKSKLIHNVKDLKTVLKMSVQSVINIGIKKTFGVIFKKITK